MDTFQSSACYPWIVHLPQDPYLHFDYELQGPCIGLAGSLTLSFMVTQSCLGSHGPNLGLSTFFIMDTRVWESGYFSRRKCGVRQAKVWNVTDALEQEYGTVTESASRAKEVFSGYYSLMNVCIQEAGRTVIVTHKSLDFSAVTIAD